MIFMNADLTSVLGQPNRYSQNLCGCWNRTLWANHALTARELRKWWQRTSYHSVAVPRRVFFVWNPVWNRNLDASWTLNIASSSNSGVNFSLLCCRFTGGLLQDTSFRMNWKYSAENWFLLCMNFMFCFRTLRSMAGGIFMIPNFVSDNDSSFRLFISAFSSTSSRV